jgi:hypothetical protein
LSPAAAVKRSRARARVARAPVAGEHAYLDPAFSDAAKRISDAMTLHYLAGSAGQWCAFRLADGTSPDHNTTYDKWVECVRFQKWNRDQFVYLQVEPPGMTAREAGAYLQYARFLHSQGWRLPPPDEFDYPDVSACPQFKADRLAMARHLISGGGK